MSETLKLLKVIDGVIVEEIELTTQRLLDRAEQLSRRYGKNNKERSKVNRIWFYSDEIGIPTSPQNAIAIAQKEQSEAKRMKQEAERMLQELTEAKRKYEEMTAQLGQSKESEAEEKPKNKGGRPPKREQEPNPFND